MVHPALFPEGSYLGRLYKEGNLGSADAFRALQGGKLQAASLPRTPPQTQISAKIGKGQKLGCGCGRGQS